MKKLLLVLIIIFGVVTTSVSQNVYYADSISVEYNKRPHKSYKEAVPFAIVRHADKITVHEYDRYLFKDGIHKEIRFTEIVKDEWDNGDIQWRIKAHMNAVRIIFDDDQFTVIYRNRIIKLHLIE